jgi:hypothetical protein
VKIGKSEAPRAQKSTTIQSKMKVLGQIQAGRTIAEVAREFEIAPNQIH